MGILFVLVALVSPFVGFVPAILLFCIVSVLMALFFVDLEHGILPDYLLALLFLLSVFFHRDMGFFGITVYIGIGLVYFSFFLMLFLVTRGRGMGFGDVKFAFVIGVLLGFPNGAMAIYLSFVFGALVSLSLIALKRKKLRGDTVPFGPFLVSGALIMLLFSEWVYSVVLSIYR